MPARELTTAAPEPREHDSAIQVVMTLPVRPRRHESGQGGQPDSVPEPESRSRIPRITQLMALAIKFQVMVEQGEVRDYADLARLGYVTRARITQIMNLVNLAPDLQEKLLSLTPNRVTSTLFAERKLRKIVSAVDWCEQRQRWDSITS